MTAAVENEDEDGLYEELVAIMLLMFFMGAGYEEMTELSREDARWLEQQNDLIVASLSGIIQRRTSGADMGATVNRIMGQAHRVYSYALVMHGLEDTSEVSWVINPEIENCADCLEQAAKGAMPLSHWQEMAGRGIYPGSSQLACTGLHCGCNYA